MWWAIEMLGHVWTLGWQPLGRMGALHVIRNQPDEQCFGGWFQLSPEKFPAGVTLYDKEIRSVFKASSIFCSGCICFMLLECWTKSKHIFFYLMALGGEDMAFIAVSTKHQRRGPVCTRYAWGETRERYHQVCGPQETECWHRGQSSKDQGVKWGWIDLTPFVNEHLFWEVPFSFIASSFLSFSSLSFTLSLNTSTNSTCEHPAHLTQLCCPKPSRWFEERKVTGGRVSTEPGFLGWAKLDLQHDFNVSGYA